MADDVEEICPAVEILTSVETAVPCPVEGCSKILFNTASLRMHVVKTHNITESEEEKALFTRSSEKKKYTKKHFYCPVVDCTRGKSSKKPFPRLGQLKQHYMTVHAEKQHTCKKCSRGFGLLAACKRHESKCGQVFHCGCGCPFTTREALLMHVRRKQHSLPAKEQVPELTAVQGNIRQMTKLTIPVQVINPATILSATAVKQGKEKTPILSQRYCKILPKPINLQNQESGSPFTGNCVASVATRDAKTQTLKLKCFKNSSTQTMQDSSTCMNDEMFSNTGNRLSNASVGTQANKHLLNSVSMIDFSGQVIVPDMDGNISQSSSIGIQHDHLFMPNHSSLGIQGDPTCFSLSSQTLLTGSNLQITDPRFVSTSETQTQDFSQVELEDNASQTSLLTGSNLQITDPRFVSTSETQTQDFSQVELEDNASQTSLLTGSNLQITDPRFVSTSETQTQGFSQVELEDNASQTSISVFGFDPSISTDCGTQTQTQKIFDELWSQTDVELTESQTQTWLSSLMPTESEITNQNHILSNRTTLDDLVNIQTQTSSMSNSMIFDAGLTNTETQTIPEAFAANSWAFDQMNRQTQMTQTATEDVMLNQLMDTYTQTFLDDVDVSVFSSVQTQT